MRQESAFFKSDIERHVASKYIESYQRGAQDVLTWFSFVVPVTLAFLKRKSFLRQSDSSCCSLFKGPHSQVTQKKAEGRAPGKRHAESSGRHYSDRVGRRADGFSGMIHVRLEHRGLCAFVSV